MANLKFVFVKYVLLLFPAKEVAFQASEAHTKRKSLTGFAPVSSELCSKE
jgi:hypothetical protein